MAYPDHSPLTFAHLTELEEIIQVGMNDGQPPDNHPLSHLGDMELLSYMLGWHDKHDHKLLAAARWALANGWPQQSTVQPTAQSTH
jgi:hypothetical protein